MTTSKAVPVVEGLFAQTAGGPRLLGSRCASCGTPVFPKAAVCRNPDCAGGDMQDAQFGPDGTVWSFTVQHYPPPPPAKYDEPYTPYAMALVDLDDGLRVLARMANAPDEVRVGAPARLVLERLYTDGAGNDVLTWMFRQV
jgi:uncharacterized OB-fold protein